MVSSVAEEVPAENAVRGVASGTGLDGPGQSRHVRPTSAPMRPAGGQDTIPDHQETEETGPGDDIYLTVDLPLHSVAETA